MLPASTLFRITFEFLVVFWRFFLQKNKRKEKKIFKENHLKMWEIEVLTDVSINVV